MRFLLFISVGMLTSGCSVVQKSKNVQYKSLYEQKTIQYQTLQKQHQELMGDYEETLVNLGKVIRINEQLRDKKKK